MLNLLMWLSTAFCCVGYYYINRLNIKGYYAFMTGNILTIIFDLLTGNWAQLIMFLIFIYFNLDGIKKWRKNEL